MLVQMTEDRILKGESKPRRKGELVELPDADAAALIQSGAAKLHEAAKPTEFKQEAAAAEADEADDDEDDEPEELKK